MEQSRFVFDLLVLEGILPIGSREIPEAISHITLANRRPMPTNYN